MDTSATALTAGDGFRWQVTESGEGPAVVMCHGFPGLGFSYRHQIRALADEGFRAVAPDMPGYGGTDTPEDVAEYTNDRVADRLVDLLDALNIEDAVLVGHDFGAPAVWTVAEKYPERVRGLVLLAVPYTPDPMPMRPSDLFAKLSQKHFLHLHYFQEPGVADREMDKDPRRFLRRLFFALSGAYDYLDIWKHGSAGNGYLDVLPHAPDLPWSWLSEDEFEHYVSVFTDTGFTGGLNWYRAYDRNWEQHGDRVHELTAPTLYIAGSVDPVIAMSGPRALDRMRGSVPDLRGVHLLEHTGHFVQQERPQKTNRLLLEFLQSL